MALSRLPLAVLVSGGGSNLQALIDRIARPFALNQPPPEESFSFARWFFEGPGAFLVIFGAVVGPILYKIAQSILARFRPCPNCGARRLRIRRTTLTPSTTSASGEGEENVTCANCDYTSTRRYTISRRSSSSRSSPIGRFRSAAGRRSAKGIRPTAGKIRRALHP